MTPRLESIPSYSALHVTNEAEIGEGLVIRTLSRRSGINFSALGTTLTCINSAGSGMQHTIALESETNLAALLCRDRTEITMVP